MVGAVTGNAFGFAARRGAAGTPAKLSGGGAGGTTRVITSSQTVTIDVGGLWGVAVWGGGQAGINYNASQSNGASSAGSGGHAYKQVRLSAKQTLSFTITSNGTASGSTGGTATCAIPNGPTLTATGGYSPTTAANGLTSSGGTASGGDVNLSGSQGSTIQAGVQSGGGSYGGPAGAGDNTSGGGEGGAGAPSSIPNLPGGTGGSLLNGTLPTFPGAGGAVGGGASNLFQQGASPGAMLIYLGP